MAKVLAVSNGPVNKRRGSTGGDRRQETVFYRVITDGKGPISSNAILLGAGAPPILSPHPLGEPGMMVVNYTVEQERNAPNVWLVGVVCDSRYEGNVTSFQPNPLQKPTVWGIRRYKMEHVYVKDLDDVPSATSAGEPILVTDQVSLPMFVGSKNVRKPPPALIKRGDFMNADSVRIYGQTFDRDTLWLTDVEFDGPIIEMVASVKMTYYRMRWTLVYNPETWVQKIRNKGFYKAEYVEREDPNTGRRREVAVMRLILVGDPKHPPAAPVPLRMKDEKDSNGVVIARRGQPFTDPASGEILAPGNPNIYGMTDAQWEEATIELRTKHRIRLASVLPLR